jgi:hypothetical protein
MEKRALHYLQHLRERLKNFITTNITWERMLQPNYRDTKIIQQFKSEIIDNLEKEYIQFMK